MKNSYSDYININLRKDENYYSLYDMKNLLRAKNDKDYCGELMEANENLIWFSVHKYIGNVDKLVAINSIDKDDIVQLGRISFLKSITGYDTTRGIKFSSYAVTAIVREIRTYLRDVSNLVRLPRQKQKMLTDFRLYYEGYISFEEFQKRTDYKVKKEEMIKILNLKEKMISFEELLTRSSENLIVGDIVYDQKTNVETQVSDKIFLKDMFTYLHSRLSPLEKKIFIGKYRGDTQTKIAKDNKISHMRVTRAVKKISTMVQTFKKEFNA